MSNEKSSSTIALITGGSRGIGKATALLLADRGIDVLLTYASSEKDAHDVVRLIESRGRRAIALRLDLGDVSSFEAFATEVDRALRSGWARETIDFLVHNGGFGDGLAPLADTTEAAFDALVGVHFKGPFFLTQKLLKRIADGGRIVNVTTGLTRYAVPNVSVYAAAKSAMEAVTRVLALELGPRRIAVNAVAPGGILTDFGGGYLRDPGFQRVVVGDTPLGRVGEPEDVAGVIASLLSTDTRWVTGQRIEVTGGYRL